MDYTHLGRSGLRVSRLCLGTMNFGPETTEPDSHRIMDAALDSGINHIDTSESYSGGLSEEFIGKAIRGKRERLVLQTRAQQSLELLAGDRVAVMNRGVLQQFGPPRVLYHEPANLFVANFIGSPAINAFRALVRKTG